MKQSILFLVMAVIVIALEVFIYTLLFPEGGSLMGINIVTAGICTLILLINVPLLAGNKPILFGTASSLVIVDIISLLLFVWTSLFSIITDKDQPSFNLLFIVDAILVIIEVVLLFVNHVGASKMKSQHKISVMSKMEKEDIMNMIKDLAFRYRIEGLTRQLSLIDTVRSLVKAYPSEKLQRETNLLMTLSTILSEIDSYGANRNKTEDIDNKINYIINLLSKK